MKKATALSALFLFSFLHNDHSFAGNTHSGHAVQESAKASSHASKSVAHALVGSGQVVSAVCAVPLYIAGSAGAVSSEIAKGLHNAAMAPVESPLSISDETPTTGPPPNEALDHRQRETFESERQQ